jgi:hypothetical protein
MSQTSAAIARTILATRGIPDPDPTKTTATAAGQDPGAGRRPMPDPAVYHGWLGETVAALGETTEADPVAILATLMAALGVMVGPGPYVQIGDDQHRALLWPLILGHTGIGRKGTSWGVGKRLLKTANDVFCKEQITSGLSSGEGLITAVADDPDAETHTTACRLVMETEYSVTMRRSTREGNTLGGILRQAWESDDLATLTKQSVHATAPHIAIIAHITPGEFRRCVNGAELAGGTYNRFLPIYSERIREIPDGEGASDDRIGNYAAAWRHIVKQAQDVGKVGLTPQARDYWTQVVYPALSASPPVDGAVAQFTARATPYARRAAMLYALADAQPIVDVGHLRAAYALVNYSRATAAYVLGTAGGTGDPHLDKVITALREAGEQGMSRKQISNLFSGHLSKAQLDDIFSRLETVPGVARARRTGAGRPADVWTLGDSN